VTSNEESCPFCEIVVRDDPDARVVYRDPHTVAFFPINPATLGHTLVVPRRHAQDIWSLSEDEAAHLSRTSIRIARAIKASINPEGLNLIQSNGAAATQTVLHFHIHLVPRWSHDRIGQIWPPTTYFSESEKDEAWAQLREAITKGAV
jgi:histidine triad (HIT) family protein